MRKTVHINSLHPLTKLYLTEIPKDGMITYLKQDRLEIFEEEAEQRWREGKTYIWAYRTLYRLTLTEDLTLDLVRYYRNPKDTCPVTRRGRCVWMKDCDAWGYMEH